MHTMNMEPMRDWRAQQYAPFPRRTNVFVGKQEIARRTMARLAILRSAPQVAVSELPELIMVEAPPDAAVGEFRKGHFDSSETYAFSSPAPLSNQNTFSYGGTLLSMAFPVDFASGTYICALAVQDTYQDLLIVDVDENRLLSRMTLYRDGEEVASPVTLFRDVEKVREHAEDATTFIDGSTINAEDLLWHYSATVEVVARDSIPWVGVRCPISVRDARGVVHGSSTPGVLDTTEIVLPYALLKLTFPQPPAIDETTVVLVETDQNLRSVVARIPLNCTSIGMPAVGDFSGLIVQFRVVDNLLQQISVLAFDFPFRTPLDQALPLAAVASNQLFDFVHDDDLDIAHLAASIARQYHKTWIHAQPEEHLPVAHHLSPLIPATSPLTQFTLYLKKQQITIKQASYAGAKLVWTAPTTKVWAAKKKARLRVSYVLNKKAHKRKLKIKVSNYEHPHSYLFELPGPLHLHFIFAPHSSGGYTLDTIIADPLKEEIVAETVAPVESDAEPPLSESSSSLSSDDDWDAYLE